MIIAQQKKQQNIIEYILYMWQIEDLIRSFNFDLDSIEKNIISQFDVDQQTKQAMRIWYDHMIAAMINEKIQQKGHLQTLKAKVNELDNLHLQLMNSPFHVDYQQVFNKAVPFLNELYQKSNKEKDKSIVELALEAMYGIWMLKLKKQKISNQTQQAIDAISDWLSLLAKKYHDKEKKDDFLI